MCVGIAIQKSPDHPLILRAMKPGLFLEEIDATLGKCNRYLLRILTKYQITRRRKKVRDDIHAPKGLICVLYWLFHTSVDLASNTPHRKYE